MSRFNISACTDLCVAKAQGLSTSELKACIISVYGREHLSVIDKLSSEVKDLFTEYTLFKFSCKYAELFEFSQLKKY